MFNIEKVIFNAPATIVLWKDGSKTVVKCGALDGYDPEKGLAMCFAKKALGNTGHYYETFKKNLPEENWQDDGNEVDYALKHFVDRIAELTETLMPKDDERN